MATTAPGGEWHIVKPTLTPTQAQRRMPDLGHSPNQGQTPNDGQAAVQSGEESGLWSLSGPSTEEWPIFTNLGAEQIQLIRSQATLRKMRTGTTILSAGHTGTGVFLLLEGTVKIFVTGDDGDEIIVALSGSGDLLGEIDAVDNCGHSANVVALEPCQVLWWSVQEFWQLLDEVPQLSRNLLTILVRRERRSTGRTSALAKLNLTGRIARQLLIFAQLYGVREEKDMVLPLRLNQTEIAALVGSSRACVNRVLSGFKAKEYIAIGCDGRITVCNVPALVGLCQGLHT